MEHFDGKEWIAETEKNVKKWKIEKQDEQKQSVDWLTRARAPFDVPLIEPTKTEPKENRNYCFGIKSKISIYENYNQK